MFTEGLCECELVLTVGQQALQQETALQSHSDEYLRKLKQSAEPENAAFVREARAASLDRDLQAESNSSQSRGCV